MFFCWKIILKPYFTIKAITNEGTTDPVPKLKYPGRLNTERLGHFPTTTDERCSRRAPRR